MKESNDFDDNIHYLAITILIIGVVFLIWGPMWFTEAAKSVKYNFTETGQIGATIGGITAPIVGVVTACLMYLAFYAQFKANKKQWKAFLKNQEFSNMNILSKEQEAVAAGLDLPEIKKFVNHFEEIIESYP
ncbi:MAG: hypothetical protein HQ522_14005 [Bacteroidetes bacterium]|nr:hypothetical protein [Bacteroidota bacterium]